MNNAKKKALISAIIFILPFFVFYTVFTIWPVFQGLYVSLHTWSLMGKQDFIGLENYVTFLNNPSFWNALGNTFHFVIYTVPAMVIVSLTLALLANRPTRLKKLYRVSFYLPSVLSVAVASLISAAMFSAHTGFINGALKSLGIIQSTGDLLWLQTENLAWVAVCGTTVWWTIGFSMMIYISALQEISPSLMEAADIDGATGAQKLFNITLPILKPTTFLVVLLQMIGSFKVFGQIWLVTGGGPVDATKPIIQLIYETGFVKNKMGLAAAMSYVLFIILIILTLVQLQIQKRSED